MKGRQTGKKPGQGDYRRLYEAIADLRSVDECARFLNDLCTPAEIEAMADRWRAVSLLKAGKSYREISELTGMSVTTIGRVARFMFMGNDGYEQVYQRLARKRK
jgi:TrpR-related protein YerC/YecD